MPALSKVRRQSSQLHLIGIYLPQEKPCEFGTPQLSQESMTLSPRVSTKKEGALQVIALGGLGEFGMNMLLVVWKDTAILIDAGSMFPDPELPGVDLVIPDLEYLKQNVGSITAITLTHAHEDHIGALPYIWPLLDGPLYGTPLTLALVEAKLLEHGLDASERCVAVEPGSTVEVDEMGIEFIQVTHSMPGCVAIAFHTPAGTIVNTGDFKFDHTPIDGQRVDMDRLAELGKNGVLALFGDSTNANQPGQTGSELDVVEGFEDIFARTTGKVIIAAFSSSLHRIQVIANLAVTFGRKLAFLGRRVILNTQIAERLGYLHLPAGLEIKHSEIKNFESKRIVCVTTGSQGEPRSALSRVAETSHPHLNLEPADSVVFSARAIPGNKRAIGRVMNQLSLLGAEVIDEGPKPVHVSGHGSAEDLKLMLALIKPRYFIPIHGEYRCLAEHAKLSNKVSDGKTDVILAQNGDVIHLAPGTGHIAGKINSGRTLLDGGRNCSIPEQVVRERRRLAATGVVVAYIAINRRAGRVEASPNVLTRGISPDGDTGSLVRAIPERLVAIVEEAEPAELIDSELLTERVRTELQRLFRKQVGLRPVVLPVIMEV